MVKRWLKYGIVLLIAAALGINYLIGDSQKVEYGIAAAQNDYKDIIVNNAQQTCFNSGAAAGSAAPIPAAFRMVAGNEKLELYLEEETAAIAVKDKCNGSTWFSYDVSVNTKGNKYSNEIAAYIKSGISIVTYNKFTSGRRTILGDNAKLTYQYRDEGFTATIDFTKAKIKFDLVVALQEGDLIIHVPRRSIEEYNPKLGKPGNNDIRLSEIIPYPFFGSATHKENGYIVLPDGAGAIVKLREIPKYATGYSAPVYGPDPGYEDTPEFTPRRTVVKPLERITLPIYGIIHEEGRSGLLVIAEGGEGYANYNYVSRDLQTNFYQSYFTYTYRTQYAQVQSRTNQEQSVLSFQEEPNRFELVQRYVFLEGDQSNYVGVAKGFRSFLIQQDGLLKQDKGRTHDQVPMKIDFVNNELAMGTLGVENVPATTYIQAQELVRKLKEKGYSELSVSFKMFVKDEWAYRFTMMNQLGGSKAFKEAVDYFSVNDIKFSHYVDYARSWYEKTKYTASKLNRKDMSVLNENKAQYNYLNNPKYYSFLAERDLEAFRKYKIGELALDGFGNSPFTHYDHGTVGYANEGMAYTEKTLKYLNDNGIKTGLYMPDAYLFKYASDYYDTSIVSSNLIFIDATVPLVPLVLSGYMDMYSPYMNFSSNDAEAILKLIEFGVFPSFVLTGESTYEIKRTGSSDVYVSQLKTLEDRIDNYYSVVSEALNNVMGSEMINHTIIDDGVVLVEYDNGRKIVINYKDTEYRYQDVRIKSKGFVIL
ncbi:DUF5696 domain-containing protein [Paenibacillus sp. FSL L8-0323]|uniref:DUF5696 domain-containing protein n=1 Tax=Paenibacillus TaxID=44249 RepID=UPI00096D77F9|nr:DUF5696 domain-containing protein [Paenibacillus odorifer]OMD13004.1 hypothetical protein BJP47_25090 [Paenibacillus odorifer]OMD21050.1 hypothetical protein BJP48_09400 [Paenibacillus odorifer]